MTRVSVVKKGKFTRSGLNEADEAEIFEGAENTLTMTQTYTWEFQCQYMLQHYPFDTQEGYHDLEYFYYVCFQECLIKMGVESEANKTVKLLAGKVFLK